MEEQKINENNSIENEVSTQEQVMPSQEEQIIPSEEEQVTPSVEEEAMTPKQEEVTPKKSKKKLIIAITAIVLAVIIAVGGFFVVPIIFQEPRMKFASEEAFKQYMDDIKYWVIDKNYGGKYQSKDDIECIHYKIYFATEDDIIKCIDFSRPDTESLQEMFENILSETIEDNTYSDAYDFFGKLISGNITSLSNERRSDKNITYYKLENYDYENGTASTADGLTQFIFLEDGTIKTNGYDICHKDKELEEISQAIENAYTNIYTKVQQEKKNEFLNEYSYAATADDVKYSPYSYLGSEFVISGTVELDDYYNYEYAGLESIYFCMMITPEGGSFSDRWYIYASRQGFSDLLEYLKTADSCSITMVAKTYYPKAASNSMATLYDYFIG